MKRSLLALASGTFALGIAEFGMMGILEDVARGMNVSIVEAGHLISTYSLGVAIGAPCLIFLRKMPLRRLLLLLAGVIAAGNLLTAISPAFWMLLVARFISGLPHGAFFGAGAIVCSKLADEGKGASAVAVMIGGMTIANLIGVPGATYVSNVISWRITFAVIALVGVIAWCGIRFWVPRLDAMPGNGGIKGQFHFLRSAAPWLIYGGVLFGQASVYCWMSYINPFMTTVAGFAETSMTWIMVLVGAGMVAGTFIAGKLADRYGAGRVCGGAAFLAALTMTAIYFCASDKIASVVLAFVAPGVLFAIGGPLQYAIVRFAKGGEMLGGAGIQIAFNVSNAIAAAMGGMVIHHGFGIAATALAGVPLAMLGFLSLWLLRRRYKAQGA